MKVLAERLKWLREQKRLGQKEVAANINVTLSGYQKMEYDQANPKIDTLIKMAQYFDVTSDFLLGLESYSNELEQMSEELESIEDEILYTSEKLDEIFIRISGLQQELLDIAQVKGFNNNETMIISKELGQFKRKQSVLNEEREVLKEKRRYLVFNYIKGLLQIPAVDTKNDMVIRSYYPYDVMGQMTLFNEIELMIISDKIGNLGTYKVYKSETDYELDKIILLEKLNGK